MTNKDKQLQVIVTATGSIQLEWTEVLDKRTQSSRPLEDEIFRRFSFDPDSWLIYLGCCNPSVPFSPSLAHFRSITALFVRKLIQVPELEELRDQIKISFSETEMRHFIDAAPLMTGGEYLDAQWYKKLWTTLNTSFGTVIQTYKGSVEEFFNTLSPDVHLVGRIFFHLVENNKGPEPFAFLATYSTRLNQKGISKHLPLKYALKEYSDHPEKLLDLLSTVNRAAQKSSFINALIESGELFHPLSWSPREAFTFLKETPIYEAAGILCRIPNWWKKKSDGITLNITMGEKKPPFVGMDAILSFDARLLIDNLAISEADVRRILEESEGLAFIKNKWVPVDHEKLKQTLAAYENAKAYIGTEGLSLKDALRFELHPEKILDTKTNGQSITLTHGDWLTNMLEKLQNPELAATVNVRQNFKADLREYQQKGLNWLYFLHSINLGACLADDMGLGKTVQLLAFLNVIQTRKTKRASLLILPASLVSNWINEIHRFFPTLNYFVAHPGFSPKNSLIAKDKKDLDRLDLIITTYTLSQKYEWLQAYTFHYVILDEAQAIKNPATQQTRSIKKLKSNNRIVMTGTPIENRLSDLWSLFDFINPGLLGNKTEFTKFSKKLFDHPEGYTRLRKVIRPYILRRLKTDKTIISDLPDKVEVKTYAPLSKKQIVLYQKLVHDMEQRLKESDGIKRKGLILSSLMKFKQICNHTDQYLGSGDFNAKDSGKFQRLREICDVIYEKREKLLIFTQFKEMTEPLAAYLATLFNQNGLILHGSVPVAKRKKIIDRFQTDGYIPFMVLSLKAGGVGLNLTQANHVIHFDRWWNPAVENQATDRVFRIGQQKKVMVHKFITQGTIEEKIDAMLTEKTKLSQDVIGENHEAWITELSNADLLNLFKLTL